MGYNSKYKSSRIEELLDKTSELNIVAVETGAEVDDVVLEYATIQYVDDAITEAIITTLNTEV
jgi:hypothetical protein